MTNLLINCGLESILQLLKLLFHVKKCLVARLMQVAEFHLEPTLGLPFKYRDEATEPDQIVIGLSGHQNVDSCILLEGKAPAHRVVMLFFLGFRNRLNLIVVEHG